MPHTSELGSGWASRSLGSLKVPKLLGWEPVPGWGSRLPPFQTARLLAERAGLSLAEWGKW